MPEFDLVIKGGTIVDGLRMPRFKGDMGIVNGRIARIGKIASSDGERVIDASGLIVAPGFVDLHTHYDSQIFWDPWCTISGYHGVTSVVTGNCGFGFAPCLPEHRERAMQAMSRNEAVPLSTMQAGMPWDWETFPEFLDSLERTPKGVNVMSYVPLAPIYAYVMGGIDAAKKRPATEQEMARMQELLVEAMDAGACGFSTQTQGERGVQRDFDGTPMITDTRSLEEMAAFARALGSTGRGFVQLSGSFELTEIIARESGRPVIFNVITAEPRGTDQHGQPMYTMEDQMEFLDRANANGLRVYAQAVTNSNYTRFAMEDYNLFDSSAIWCEATLGTKVEKLGKLADEQRRVAMRAEFDSLSETALEARSGPGIIPELEVSYIQKNAPEEVRRLQGRIVGDIARAENRHPVDVMLDIACATDLKAEFANSVQKYTDADMERMAQLVKYKYGVPGVSDGGAHTTYLALGTYTTEYLCDFVRDHEVIDLEEAHWRLSAYPAEIAGIRDRGFLREGAPADIVVYDLEKLQPLPSERTFDFPAGQSRLVRKANGYRYTIVNGEVTFEDSNPTGAVSGQLLRHGAADRLPVGV